MLRCRRYPSPGTQVKGDRRRRIGGHTLARHRSLAHVNPCRANGYRDSDSTRPSVGPASRKERSRMSTATGNGHALGSTTRGAPPWRRLWARQLPHYPDTGPRTLYLGLTVAATIVLYYELY